MEIAPTDLLDLCKPRRILDFAQKYQKTLQDVVYNDDNNDNKYGWTSLRSHVNSRYFNSRLRERFLGHSSLPGLPFGVPLDGN